MLVCITGSSGFLGSIIKEHIIRNNTVFTIGRNNQDVNFNFSEVSEEFMECDVFIHSAGLAHLELKSSHLDPFYEFNVKGTEFLLKSIEKSKAYPKSFVFISSVSVYGLTVGENISEEAPLLASDNYGRSKILAENIITNWCEVNSVKCLILRLPLVVGDNPPGNLNSLLKSVKNEYYFNIDGGKARKSMVLGIDVASIILKAADIGGCYNLTDDFHPSFFEISKAIAIKFSKRNKIHNIPLFFAFLLSRLGDISFGLIPLNTVKYNKIISTLTFDNTKAKNLIDWNPRSVLDFYKV
jgi:nucleoside-diphosphate-sugar epimerase